MQAGFVAQPMTVINPQVGAPTVAQAGSLIFALAGKQGPVARTSPLAKLMGKTIIDLSGQPQGRASLLKLVANSFTSALQQIQSSIIAKNTLSTVSMLEGLSDSLVLAEKTGLPIDSFLQFIQAFCPPPAPQSFYVKRMMEGKCMKNIIARLLV